MPFTCQHCEKAFARVEHMRRHVQTVHYGTKRYACPVCFKRFDRSDSCRRHQAGHRFVIAGADGRVESLLSTAPVSETTNRACQNCASARNKCSGGERCTRCADRGLPCTYPKRSNAKRQSQYAPVITEDSHGPAHAEAHTSLQQPRTLLEQDASLGRAAVAEHPFVETGAAVPVNNPLAFQQLQPGPISPQTFPLKQPEAPSASYGSNVNWLSIPDGLDLSFLDDLAFDIPPQLEPAAHQRPEFQDTTPTSYISHTASSEADLANASSPASQRRKTAQARYVDGDGARDTLQHSFNLPRRLHATAKPAILGFPRERAAIDEDFPPSPALTPEVYSQLKYHHTVVCCSDSVFYRAFDTNDFPTIEHLQLCIHLYATHFAPVMPFVHHTCWESATHWILLLQIITIGASFDICEGAQQTYFAFTEFARRAVRLAREREALTSDPWLPQACLLHAIAQFGNASSTTLRDALVDLQASSRAVPTKPVSTISSLSDQWVAWIYQESRCRLAWYSWLLQLSVCLTEPNSELSCLPDDLALPVSSKLWSANCAEQWLSLSQHEPAPVTHGMALHALYISHEIPVHMDSTNISFLTYAVIARTAEVGRSLAKHYDDWNLVPVGMSPDAGKTRDDTKRPWMPSHPRYAVWRNSACDCFDLLHWSANSQICLSQGFEDPMILHLHVGRLILLCPLDEFMLFAAQLGRGQRGENGSITIDAPVTACLSKWLTVDQHKGRLSLVHAGAIFWHVRRYSTALFYEPFAIYAATLTLCIYGLFHPQAREVISSIRTTAHQSRDTQPDDSESIALVPNTILVDRPCDDEVVQTFIRRGHTMTAAMSGGGDISTTNGVRFVLEEANKLLQHPQYSYSDKAAEYRRILVDFKRHI